MTHATASRKPVKPVSGSCRWLVPLVIGLRPGRLAITNARGVTAEYTVTPHADHTGRVIGYRLTKDDGTAYDVDSDLWECDCPDYLTRAARREGGGCKHTKALRAALPRCPVLI